MDAKDDDETNIVALARHENSDLPAAAESLELMRVFIKLSVSDRRSVLKYVRELAAYQH